MAVSITELMEEVKTLTAWQATPYPLLDHDYYNMIIRGIKRLFTDTNRPEAYDKSLITTIINDETSEEEIIYNMPLNIIEEEYIKIMATMEFFKRVQTDVNDKFSYSTDAIKVTNADKPYANLKDSLDKLENERRILYYKMTDYTLGI